MTTRRGFLGVLAGSLAAVTGVLTRRPAPTLAVKSAGEALRAPGGDRLGPYSLKTHAAGFRVSCEAIEDDKYQILNAAAHDLAINLRAFHENYEAKLWNGVAKTDPDDNDDEYRENWEDDDDW